MSVWIHYIYSRPFYAPSPIYSFVCKWRNGAYPKLFPLVIGTVTAFKMDSDDGYWSEQEKTTKLQEHLILQSISEYTLKKFSKIAWLFLFVIRYRSINIAAFIISYLENYFPILIWCNIFQWYNLVWLPIVFLPTSIHSIVLSIMIALENGPIKLRVIHNQALTLVFQPWYILSLYIFLNQFCDKLFKLLAWILYLTFFLNNFVLLGIW